MTDPSPASPLALTIFGGTGDLSFRKLLPALYMAFLHGRIPADSRIIATGRQVMTTEAFREQVTERSRGFVAAGAEDAGAWQRFMAQISYVELDASDATGYARLGAGARPGETRVFYLATAPALFTAICAHLDQAGLIDANARVVLEKPLGHDLDSARAINAQVAQHFAERQIYRIGHYLGKETVQNLLVIRFANSIFEPIWNHKYIDHVQITVSEAEGVGTRAAYYEEAGALRDMVQNHMLQLLCLVAMEPPYSLDPDVVRNAKMEVLRCLRPISGREVEQFTVRAQYTEGVAHGKPVPGYRREAGINPNSTTETYVAVKCFVENWRWSGVPFYLRTGKALPLRASEVAVQFKDIPQILFNANGLSPQAPNVLTLRIQPEEGLSLRIVSRVPGTRAQTHPVEMNFKYGEVFGRPSPEAYERLLWDVMAGDASRFMRRDAVEASWAWITKILEGWQQSGQRWLPEYQAGSWGPVEADRLIQNDGRSWRTL